MLSAGRSIGPPTTRGSAAPVRPTTRGNSRSARTASLHSIRAYVVRGGSATTIGPAPTGPAAAGAAAPAAGAAVGGRAAAGGAAGGGAAGGGAAGGIPAGGCAAGGSALPAVGISIGGGGSAPTPAVAPPTPEGAAIVVSSRPPVRVSGRSPRSSSTLGAVRPGTRAAPVAWLTA